MNPPPPPRTLFPPRPEVWQGLRGWMSWWAGGPPSGSWGQLEPVEAADASHVFESPSLREKGTQVDSATIAPNSSRLIPPNLAEQTKKERRSPPSALPPPPF